jgi:hypothetical protein
VVATESIRNEKRTVIVYVVANVDEQVEENIKFFVTHGVHVSSKYDYFIVEQQSGLLKPLQHLYNMLPENAHVIFHQNECYDLGTVGWLLFESGEVDVTGYSYFGWLNPSVRGPFLPSYLDQTDWPRLFTDKLDEDTKLSGTALSCGGTIHSTMGALSAPHLQSYLIFTDEIGLTKIKEAGALKCFRNMEDTIYFGEIGASLSILNAGYNIHSSLLRYQDVDWRDKSHWNCNGKESLVIPTAYDGGDVDPLEVMFIKYKRFQKWWPSQQRASLYSSFHDPHRDISVRLLNKEKVREGTNNVLKILAPYFDAGYYVGNSRDLHVLPLNKVICHFATNGFQEARPFRLVGSCGQEEFGGDDDDPANAFSFATQTNCVPKYAKSAEDVLDLVRQCS